MSNIGIEWKEALKEQNERRLNCIKRKRAPTVKFVYDIGSRGR